MTHRSERVVACAVTGASLLIGGLALWAMISSTDAGDTVATARLVVYAAVNSAAGVLLWWHRRFPARVFVALLLLTLVSAIATGTVGNSGMTIPLWFSVFALTAFAPLKRAVVAVVLGWIADTIVKVSVFVADGYTFSVAELALTFLADVGFLYIVCGALGLGFRFQLQRVREAAEHARLVEEHARALRAEAVASERNRLARDLHDLAAHELMDALLAVRALQVGSADPDLVEIEEKTGRALENMRTVVRTLREDDLPEPDRLPLRDAALRLIDGIGRDRNLTIESRVGEVGYTDDAVAQALLRVLQECLLNAARHAPAADVTVELETGDDGVRLTVSNAPVAAVAGPAEDAVAGAMTVAEQGTGYGLIGARERARLVGGSFHAEQSPDGGWVSTLRLPVTARPDRSLR